MVPDELLETIVEGGFDVIALRGAPGEGKTHLARELADLLDWPLVSTDEIGFSMFHGRQYFQSPNVYAKINIVNRLATQRAARALEGVGSVIIDRTHSGMRQIRETQQLSDKVLWVEVVCSSPKELRRRLAERPEGLEFWADIHHRIENSLSEFLPLPVYIVDSATE